MRRKPLFDSRLLMVPLALVGGMGNVWAQETDLLNLSVEDLLNVEVTSVSKKAEALNDSPAAIYVISQDDIRRIGATSIPEALRLAPGIDVARIDAHKWAVSARGFNGRFANKLLVLIDGRSIYSRVFAGVYWENQDVMLEDVDRIEVIRGPGAALWGANAVNGVINIITKHSAETQGGLLVAGGGTEEQGFGAFRYGDYLSSSTTGRVYVKGFKRDESSTQTGAEAGDDWDKVQGGFRLDSQYSANDSLTLQGDVYYAHFNQHTSLPSVAPPYLNRFNETIDSYGGNVLMRQQHTFSSTSDSSLQVYYDFYKRDEVYFNEARHTVDADFQHRFALTDWNDVVWGLGYRYSHDETSNTSAITLQPLSRNDQLVSAFVQDEITLIEDLLWLTIGSKFEHNDYSGFEGQPSARLMWAPHRHHRVWAAVSRAVRTPSRFEHDMNFLQQVIPPGQFSNPLPIAIELEGNRGYDSEEVISYELGYRTTMIDRVSLDLTAFYTDYRNLRSADESALVFSNGVLNQKLMLRNRHQAHTYGVETAAVWQMLDWWRWDVNYSLLKTDLSSQLARVQTGRSPEQRVTVRAAVSPRQDIDLDVFFRYVDSNQLVSSIDNDRVKDYVSLDLRFAWRPSDGLELSLVGQNLLDSQRLEYRQEILTAPTEIDRGFYGKFRWEF